MKIIVPCAGRSSRFPNMAPKWMLPDHDGWPMVIKALEGLAANPDDIVFTMLREHAERFDAVEGLRRAYGRPVHCVVLDEPTSSQSETVAETLRRTGIDEPFLVKDSDNHFELAPLDEPFNYVSVASLNDFDSINPRNKSFVQVDQEGIITNFREKEVISDLFSVGGYFFSSPAEFLTAYDELLGGARLREGELYISEIIAFMILNGNVFKTRRVAHYQDWGTVHEWRSKLERRRLFVISVDGFLFERGSLFFSPSFDQVRPNAAAVEAARTMGEENHGVIYLSIRPPEMTEMTRAAIAALGLPPGELIMGCGVAQWALITASHPTLPFTSSRAVEISPDDPNIVEKLDL